MKPEGMTFKEALKILKIEEYGERIFHSNSHGELFHTLDYISVAERLHEGEGESFREWFVGTVELAEEKWKRPESVFQHLIRLTEEAGLIAQS